ncbi:hypothetical protein Tco_1569684 [Tanacetum coccineum]
MKSSFQLVDEPDEEPAHSEPKFEPEQEGSGEEYDMERAIQMSLESFQAQGHAHVGGVAIQEPVAEAIRPFPVDDTSTNIVRDSPSPTNAKTRAESDKTNSGGDTEILQIAKQLGEDVTNQVNLKEKTAELDQDQAGSDPGESLESQAQPEQVHMDEDQAEPDPGINRMALDGLDPDPTYDKFMADLYSKVQESLKFLADEHENSMWKLKWSPWSLFQYIKRLSLFLHCPHHTTESELAERVAALEKKLSDLEQNNKNLDNTTRNLGSRVYLELMDLPHRINESQSMKNQEACFKSSTGSPSRLLQRLPQAPQSSAWKKSDTRDAPSSSSKQQSGPHAEQPVEDIPIQDSDNISDSEDTDSAHLPKTKQRPEWLKPIPDDERPATPEPAWVISTSHIPDVIGKTELTQADLEGQAYEVVKPFYPDVVHLHFHMEECHKGSRQALSISKIKAALYHDFGIELLVLEHIHLVRGSKSRGGGQILGEFWALWINEFLKGICKRVMAFGELREIIREVFVKLLLDSFGKLSIRAARIWLKTSSLPPLPLSSPLPLPPPIILSRTRASMILIRDVTPSTYILAPRLETPPSGTPPLLPIPLPTSSPPLLLHSADCRADVLEVMLPPQKRPIGGFRADYVYVGSLDAEIRHDLDWEIGYRITDVWVDPDEIVEEIPATNVAELGQRMTDFLTYYIEKRALPFSHVYLFESEAIASRGGLVQSIDSSNKTQTTGTACRGTDSDEDIADLDGSTTESAGTCSGSSTS